MIFIIESKKYDTEKAQKVISYMQPYPTGEIFGHTVYGKKETTLYRTTKCNWFTTVKGDYDTYKAYRQSEKDVKALFEDLNQANLYNKYFNDLEDA